MFLFYPSFFIWSDESGDGDLVVIKNTQLREKASNDSKLIFNLYPTLLIKKKLTETKLNSGWVKVDSGFCTLKSEHKICNSVVGLFLLIPLRYSIELCLKNLNLKKL